MVDEQVGWQMKRDAGKKKVTLELGGNAGCIIEDVQSEAELQEIVSKLAFGAYYQSGQSCISVQRIFVRKVLKSSTPPSPSLHSLPPLLHIKYIL